MSAQFDSMIHHLKNNPDASIRVKAAQALGQAADSMNDEQYSSAMAALNQAMTDPDPMVLMAVMNAMSYFDRGSADYESDESVDTGPAVQASACRVCGKPEALVDPNECEFANCPYK
jgi:hypothetical protein